MRSSCLSFAQSSSVSTDFIIGFKPSVPISRPRSAFCSDSLKLRPIAMTTLAIVFALAYERTGKILVPMIAHGLFNLNTVLLVFAGVNVS